MVAVHNPMPNRTEDLTLNPALHTTKPLHVMFVTGEYPPMQGGVGAYTHELGKALRALGAQVTVLTSEAACDPATAVHCGGCRVLPAARRWDWSIWRLAANLAHEVRCDWLHVQYQTAAFGMHPAINFAPSVWARQGFQVAWTYHDLLVPYLFPKAGKRLRTWITERPAHTAALPIVTNEADRQQLAAKGIAAASIPIGSNIVGRQLSPEERAAWRAGQGCGPDDLLLAYFGFLNRSKGLVVLVKAFARIVRERPDAQLLMVGEQVGASDTRNDAYRREVLDLIARLGLEHRVRWTGSLPDAEVGAALNACDVLLMPYVDGASLRRGTLMAGLANGCAIVTTTPQGPLPELQDGRDLFYVRPEDEKALAHAALRVAADAELAARLRANARARSHLFAWDAIARQHLAWYRDPSARTAAAALSAAEGADDVP
jgi:glycosyltransferase involved in cell wall biosynthesis